MIKIKIIQPTVMQCLGRDLVVIFGVPSVVYPSSNWDGYLRCSHGWKLAKSVVKLIIVYVTPKIIGDDQPWVQSRNANIPGLRG